ncbi:hypothetical protein H2200_010756 [Cladophialophora chaetospira]|uniref:AB hydrolase-1 domain-containing protein n=1 Tax=Cladophialophora chaetospira TaxID=386627 RepID=A0AA39CDX8_9EURO|nr:hypothetical protein H2200_010756 [Cladophialophora chaetospira]
MSSIESSSLEHTDKFRALKQSQKTVGKSELVKVPVGSTSVRGYIHLPAGYADNKNAVVAAAILLSGAGGGVTGPSGIYVSIGDKLSSLSQGIPVLRLDYRHPGHNDPCNEDMLSAMDFLEKKHSIRKFVLVGWSFGGAPVFTIGGQEKDRVIGCATIASQTAAAGGIKHLAPRPVLLLHGTGDKVLNSYCSQSLYNLYGKNGNRTLKFFEGDDHALTGHPLEAEELLCEFIAKCVGVEISSNEQGKVIGKKLTANEDRIDLMKKGGDLNGERIE